VEVLVLEVLLLEVLEWEQEQVPELVLEPEKRQLVECSGMPLHSADRLSPFCLPKRLSEWYLLATLLESVEHWSWDALRRKVQSLPQHAAPP
jgi:hypothetical protein